MITTVHGRVGCIPIPQFPDSGGSVGNHISPSGVLSMGSQNVCHIRVSHSYKFPHQPLHADDSALNGGVVIIDCFVNDLSGHSLSFCIRYHVECQWEQIGCYGVIAIISLLTVPESLVKTFFYFLCQCLISPDILF